MKLKTSKAWTGYMSKSGIPPIIACRSTDKFIHHYAEAFTSPESIKDINSIISIQVGAGRTLTLGISKESSVVDIATARVEIYQLVVVILMQVLPTWNLPPSEASLRALISKWSAVQETDVLVTFN